MWYQAVSSSGALSVTARKARSTGSICSTGHRIRPPNTSAAGVQRRCSSVSDDPEVAATAADGPEQLGVARVADTSTTRPKAVDQLAPRMLFAPSPYARPNQLIPPVIVMPTTDGSGLLPGEVGQAGALEGGEQLAGLDARADGDPPGARVDRDRCSRARVRSSNTLSMASTAPWPTGCAVTWTRCSTAQRTAAWTSSASRDLEHRHRSLVDGDRPRAADDGPSRVGGM